MGPTENGPFSTLATLPYPDPWGYGKILRDPSPAPRKKSPSNLSRRYRISTEDAISR